MSGKMNRRDFLKALGVGGAGMSLAACDMPTTVTLEEGKEEVVSYLMPEEYVIPGVGVWFASTCTQCASGCGVHGRVREGRVLKVEGNPDSPISGGRSCQMGQAGVQAHYNPDRLTSPMARKNGKLSTVSWDEATTLLQDRLKGTEGKRIAWLTGTISGHQRVLVDNFQEAVGSDNTFTHEVVNDNVWSAVSRDMLGDSNPSLRIDKADVVLSLGSDFMGASGAPVLYSRQYAEFRGGKRGTLIHVESKMTMSGGSADFWLPIRPGTEGVFAMGVANYLMRKGSVDTSALDADLRRRIDSYDVSRVADITGVAGDRIQRIAQVLQKGKNRLVLAGPSVQAQEQGYESTAAIMALNIMLGAVGTTIEPGTDSGHPALQARTGGTADLIRFAEGVKNGDYDMVMVYGSNPLYTAPDSIGLKENFQTVKFKVTFTQFMDETAAQADLVLPLDSGLEDWGTHMAAVQGDNHILGIQQPLMGRLHQDTRGFGDIMLSLLKTVKPEQYQGFEDYYAYVANALAAVRPDAHSQAATAKEFWQEALQGGQVKIAAKPRNFKISTFDVDLPDFDKSDEYPLRLVPSARMGLFDGRHANLPWLQESPDQIAKVVWDSWAEIHPATAERLGVKHGDMIKITSAAGSIETKAYLIKSVHHDVIAVPLGQGHTDYGRYASGRGVNPLNILEALTDGKTGELAMYATKVKIVATGKTRQVVRLGASDSQVGRGFVRTVPVETLRRTEGA